MKTSKLPSLFLLAFTLLFASCSPDDFLGRGGDDDAPDDGADDQDGFVGAVYAMTNGEGQVPGTTIQGPNTVVAYGRSDNGSLTPIGPLAAIKIPTVALCSKRP